MSGGRSAKGAAVAPTLVKTRRGVWCLRGRRGSVVTGFDRGVVIGCGSTLTAPGRGWWS